MTPEERPSLPPIEALIEWRRRVKQNNMPWTLYGESLPRINNWWAQQVAHARQLSLWPPASQAYAIHLSYLGTCSTYIEWLLKQPYVHAQNIHALQEMWQ